jgi:hypothetical protein
VTTDGRDICLACGGLIEPGLLFAASLRCHECRAERATLRAYPVEKRRAGRGPGRRVRILDASGLRNPARGMSRRLQSTGLKERRTRT